MLFLTNDVRHAPEDFVRKLWRLGFQASLAEVVTVGAALQFHLAGRDRGTAFVIGSDALIEHVDAAGLRILNRTPFATRADVVVVGAHDDFIYDELRTAAQAVLRGAELVGRDARPDVPDARRPVARHAAPCSRRSRPPPGARPTWSSASPSRRCTRRPATASARAGCSRSATCWRSTWRAPGGPASTRRSCSPAGRTREEADAADPRPTHVADSLAALVLA